MRIDNRWVVGAMIAVAPVSAIWAAQQTAQAPIKQVTVYTDMARVVRAAVVNLQPGDQTVLVENLPTNSDPGSYRVEVPGDNGVTMVNFRQEAKDYIERISRDVSGATKLRDSLIRQRNLINDHRAAFQAQKELLVSFQGVSQQTVGQQMSEGALNVAQWEGAFRFVGQRMIEVGDSLRESDRALGDLGQRISACDGQISRAYDEIRHVGRSIFVDLQAKSPITCTVLVSYMIAGASWTPTYDARLAPDGKLVEMTAFALISQSTGEQWDSVELVLSTSSPNSNVGPGEYRPLALKVVEPVNDIGKTITVSGTRDIIDKFATTNQVSISQEAIKRRPAQSVDDLLKTAAGVQSTSTDRVFVRGGGAGEVAYTVDGVPIGDPLGGGGRVGENQSLLPSIPVTFKARRLESVKSGQEPVRTIIGDWQLDAKTRILARPRALEGAYRVVTINNQNTVPLLSGPVALFTGTEYIGASSLIRLIPQNAEFELPFGRENRVSVERKQTNVTRDREKSETKVDQMVRFTLKNHSDFTSTIQLEEPLPLSQDDRIKVRLDSEKIPKPQIDYQGRAVWTITLAPGQTDSLSVPIQVSFPSSMRISGL